MDPAAKADRVNKLIVRMNGHGDLETYAEHADGTRVQPISIKDDHVNSTYDRFFPGTTEWGVFYMLAKVGCWQLHFARSDVAGDIWIIVQP